jgi:predicted transcriptional regulator
LIGEVFMVRLGDLFFELSNEDRRRILLTIREKPLRLTQISQGLGLTIQEVSRQLSRLEEVGLEFKDAKGYHHLTHYGEIVLRQLRGVEFTSRFREYFLTHSLDRLSSAFVDRIGDLSDSKVIINAMDFLRHTENLLKESKEYAWILVDQFPMNSLSSIVEAIERGVQFRCIEPRERMLNPDIESMTSEETQALSRTRQTPLVDQRMVDEVDVHLVLSENRCVLAFPTSDGQYDYRGFTATDDSSLTWCEKLFQYYWDKGKQRTSAVPAVQIKRGKIFDRGESLDQIVVVGRENPDIDAQAVQDAVDNYDEVILKGTFNFGTSEVVITRSISVRGEGRENDVPLTIIYKQGWTFPFMDFDSIFHIEGEAINVTIENIHFTDFNCACIKGGEGNSLDIKNNMITLGHGYGRGATFGAFGDIVMGIWAEGPERGNFPGGVTIEGNFIDFACGGARGGFVSRGGLEENPNHRPDLFNHEYYIGVGINVDHSSGLVRIENNTVRNANARGIAIFDNTPSAEVRIRNNIVSSDVYGSYPFSSLEAGAGILAVSGFGEPKPGYNVEIEGNTIKLDKLNYCGIKVLGPLTDREGADKLRGGTIRNNRIQLKDGYEGIHVRKSDDFEVSDNTISGEAYYGIRVSGRRRSGELDLRALNNLVEGNDMGDLQIREPDKYSDNHVDGRMFTGAQGKSATAHFWLGKHTKGNVLKIMENETVIDEGEENQILYQS